MAINASLLLCNAATIGGVLPLQSGSIQAFLTFSISIEINKLLIWEASLFLAQRWRLTLLKTSEEDAIRADKADISALRFPSIIDFLRFLLLQGDLTQTVSFQNVIIPS